MTQIEPHLTNRRRHPALRVAIWYALFGVLWIACSDTVIDALIEDRDLLTAAQMYKGWFFIAVTAILVYWLVDRHLSVIRRAESALVDSEEKYRLLVENQTDLIIKIDREGRFLFVSPSCCELFGKTQVELIGSSFLSLTPDDDRSTAEQEMRRFFEPPYESAIEQRALTKHGWRWIAWGGKAVLNKDGTVQAIVGVGRDITEQKETDDARRLEHERGQAYLSTAGVMFVGLDHQGRVDLINPRGCEILGKDRNHILGKDWFENFLPESIREQVRSKFRQLISGSLEHVEYHENPVLAKSGDERLISWHNALITDENGAITGTISSGLDITEQRLAEQKLSESRAMWQSAVRAAPIGIGLVKNRVLGWTNERIQEMTGRTAEELEGASARILYPTEQEYLRVGQVKHPQIVQHGLGTIETQWKRKDGTIIDVRLSSACIHPPDLSEGLVFTAMDITERKRAQEALTAERNLVTSILNTSPVAILVLDRNGHITFANPAAEKVLGLTPSTVSGRAFDEPGWRATDYDGHDLPEERLPFHRVRETGAPVYDVRHAIEWPDGRRVLLSVNAAPQLSATGEFDGMVAAIEDVTERIQTQQALSASEHRFRSTVQASPMGMFTYRLEPDRRLVFVDANPAADRILAVDCRQFIGKTIEEAFPPLAQTEVPDRYRETAETGSTWHTEQIEYEDDQITGAYEVYAFQIAPRTMAAMFFDITDRKRAEQALRASEEKFRTLTEATSDWVWEADAQGRYTYASPKVKDLLGYGPEEIIGRTTFDLAVPDVAPQVRQIFERSVAERRPIVSVEHTCLHKDGRLVVIETNGVPIISDDGSLLGYRGIDRDITQRKRTEEALRESELRYRMLFETANDANIVIDVNSRTIVDCNQRTFDMFRCVRDYIIGRGPQELSAPAQPDGQDSEKMTMEFIAAAARGKPQFFEWRHLRADGTHFDAEISLNFVELSEGDRIQAIVRDITERKRNEMRQARMMQELDHRVKNNLAAVLAMAEQTIATSPSLPAFRESFVGRLRAMARTHEALAASKWEGVPLAEIVRLTLEPYERGGGDLIRAEGETVMLPAAASLPMCMALHELATNAAKYGALSTPEGRVHVTWRRDDDSCLSLQWTERGGPPVTEPRRVGFGMSLVRGVMKHELRGSVEMRFDPHGLVCRMNIPLTPPEPAPPAGQAGRVTA